MPRQPNILVIIADQLRRQALSCYGEPDLRTPHIDRLAAEGCRFDAACSTYPVCVPFRFTMMTGRPAHTRMIPAIGWRMSPAERLLCDEWRDAGYHTAYVGKWHLDGGMVTMPGYSARHEDRRPVSRAHSSRWDKWLGFELRNGPHDTCYFEDDDPTPKPIEGYQTDGLFDLAMGHIADGRPRERPFACVLSVEPPHPPYEAPPDLEERWLERAITVPDNVRAGAFVEDGSTPNARIEYEDGLLRRRKIYHAMVENLDDNVGRMLDFLERQGLSEDTLVVFLSDHGELGGAHGLLAKQYPFEESIGIPLIARGPGVPAGRAIADPVCTEDLFPSLVALAGARPRDDDLPGCDLAPLIRGQRDGLEREAVPLQFVWENRPNMAFFEKNYRGLRTRRHSYTVLGDLHGAEPWQLFDLEEDPLQQHNRVADPAYRELAAHLHGMLRAQLAAADDPFPLRAAFGHPALNVVA